MTKINDKKLNEAVLYAYEKGCAFLEEELFSEAATQFKIAAEQGHAFAQERLGELYMGGMGVEEDQKMGVMWLRKSAAQNNADACRAMGLCYWYGDGVEENNVEAKKWFQKALDLGCEGAKKWIELLEQEQG